MKLTVLSLGAGVQSTVMALMAAKGEVGPMPDAAIFSDTGWEPKSVYDHLYWLEGELPYPVYRVSKGNIRGDLIASLTGSRFAGIPLFTKSGGMGMRQCTNEYKIQPVRKKIRELFGLNKGQRVPKDWKSETWIGISTDEMVRMKMARDKWQEHRWPLIEQEMSRIDCLRWFDKHYPGRTLGKSSCIGCPFHDNATWRDMRDNDPVSWADAVEVDKLLREAGTVKGMKEQQFMHRSLVPLDEVDLRTAKDMGQHEFGFLDECDGMCGV